MRKNENKICSARLSLIEEITTLACATNDTSALLQVILERSLKTVGGMRGFVALVDLDSGQLLIRHTAGKGWDKERIASFEKYTSQGKGITSHVGATSKPYITGNVKNDRYYKPFFSDVESVIAVPLVDAYARSVGVIVVDSPKPDAYSRSDSMLLSAFANIITMSLSNSQHRERERAFVEIGTELAGSTDIPSLAAKVINVTAEVLHFEDCSLFFLDRDGHTLTLESSRGPLNKEVGKASYKLGEGLTGWIAEHGQPIRISDIKSDPRWRGVHSEFPTEEIGAFLGVPIEGQNGTMGVLRVVRRKSRFPWFRSEFTVDDQSVLMSIASQIGAAIQNLRLTDRVVAAERMAAWGEMSARSAHMIGNRVFAIKGDLNELDFLITEKTKESKKFKLLLEGIRNGVYRLEEILQEFRDFVLATQLSLSEYDLNDVIEQTLKESFPKRSKVGLEKEMASGLPRICADLSKLKRCFAELIENAINFQADGGNLTVKTSLANPKEARQLCGLSSKRRYVRIEFADSGPGIPKKDKDKIFNPFFTSRAKGMGLGLSIVKGIIEAHHGRICETGSPNKGARFVIFLPAINGENTK